MLYHSHNGYRWPVTVTKTSKNVDAAMRAMDWLYSEEGINESKFGREGIDWVKDGDEFVYRIEKNALESQITLGATFVLDTKTKHDNFALALSGNVVIYVTDGKVTQ